MMILGKFLWPKHCLTIGPINAKESDNVPAGNYMFKVTKRRTRTRCKICSNLLIKTPELMSFLLTLNTFHTLF